MEKLNRRVFIGSGIAGLAAAQRTSAASANDRIRVAVVGIRNRGWQLMQSIHELSGENLELAAVCDVDESVIAAKLGAFEKLSGKRLKSYTDMRALLDDHSIDAVFHATPAHWHSLGGVWTCMAGKDAYIEKPMSHSIWEGRQLVNAARREKRIVQHGTQIRSSPVVLEAVQKMREGLIGELFMARGVCFKAKGPLGPVHETATPAGVHYDKWLGPAPLKPFSLQRFHTSWYMHWDYGVGDIGNMGIHQLDLIRMGLGLEEHPAMVQSMGGKFLYNDYRETPNVHSAFYHYAGRKVQVEMSIRSVPTNLEAGMGTELPFRLGSKDDIAGVIFYGSEGYIVVPDYKSYYSFLGVSRKPGPSRVDTDDLLANLPHIRNFVGAMRTRNHADLTADVEQGHRSTSLSHLANISYKVGRGLAFDPHSERFSEEEANSYLKRAYREPYVMPEIA
jgi:predicted dehydrogenase